MKSIDPNGDNYLIFVLGVIPKDARTEVHIASFRVNFYPFFYDLVKEEF